MHPKAGDLDLCKVGEVIERMHKEDLVAVKAVGRVLPEISRAAGWIEAALSRGGRLFYVGAGTSGRLGVLDAAELGPTFGVSPEQVQALIAGGERALVHAQEGAEDDTEAAGRELAQRKLTASDVVVGLSASGRTPYVIGALAFARNVGARTVLVACNATTPAKAAALVIRAVTGPELLAGSTRLKAGTATKLILNALSTSVMVARGRVFRGRMVTMRPTNAKLRKRAVAMVGDLTGLPASECEALLDAAGGETRIAVAMAFTGTDADTARRKVESLGLRRLERDWRRDADND